MSKIRENIYLGNWKDAQNLEGLRQRNISHILRSAFELNNVYPNEFTYKVISADDVPSYNMAPFFDEAADWINYAVHNGTGVFIHCHMGISRSTTLLLTYMMKYEGLGLPEALRHVKSRRPIANPNSGFMKQLKVYERTLRDRMRAQGGQGMVNQRAPQQWPNGNLIILFLTLF